MNNELYAIALVLAPLSWWWIQEGANVLTRAVRRAKREARINW